MDGDKSVRKRRKVESSNAEESEDIDVIQRRSSRIDQTCTKLIVLISGVVGVLSILLMYCPDSTITAFTHKSVDYVLMHAGVSPKIYAIVLDAGSTGSRVLGFTFYENPVTGNLLLVDELWKEVKPGLSSFADDPDAGAESIQTLINEAHALVPPHLREQTPVSLKATAGLRLLPQHKSEALISSVTKVLGNSGFSNRGVEILSELHEGLYGWITVNFLMDQLSNPRKSYVALDLGGGSTQITFSPKHEETFQETPSDFLHQVSVISQKMTIYSHSYLGLGLMAARDAVFNHRSEGSATITSPCVSNPLVWSYNYKEITIHPRQSSYESCMIQVIGVLDTLKVHQCEEVPTRKIAAFSYFYDRAVDAGIIEHGQSAVVQVQDFLDAAKVACDSSEHPFLCVDLTFISGLLHHGYKLSADAKLGLYKEINGHSTSWALGAAFALLEK
jgi:ectonucleoside triphosphate diphosphohydrolase 5/6